MSTNIQTIGSAILFQTMVRYSAFIAMEWIGLYYADIWLRAYCLH